MTKKSIIKSLIIGSLTLVAIFGIGLYTNVIKLPITNYIHLSYPADANDDRILMGASQNVFVGKVIKEVRNKSVSDSPVTHFEVEIISNIKGDLRETVIVEQAGGYKNGILHLVSGGDVVGPADLMNKESTNVDTLFEVGSTYLFATRHSGKNDWYTFISHPNGRKLISADKNATKAELEILVKNDAKVLKLQEAYKNEILLDVDVKNNNIRNSYQSLQAK